jgi:STE24 endopeptidase
MTRAGRVTASLLVLCTLAFAALARAQARAASAPQPAAAAATSPASTAGPALAFDPEAATREWLAKVPPDKKERSDAYFEGGYWLQLWGFLYGLAVAWLLLGTGISRRLRELAERTTRFRPLQTAIYAVGYVLLTTVLGFPLSVYSGYLREHQYELSNQTFGAWMNDQAKGLAVGLVLGPLAFMVLYAVFRRAPRTWWVWGTLVSLVLLAVIIVIAPVLIDPIFHEYTRLEDPQLRDPILRMAQANGVPARDVWVFDASKQHSRISANVSGLFGTERVRLNDNLLNRCTPPEVEAVMGHELGHYVLNHVYEDLLELGLVVLLGFAFLHFTFERVRRRAPRWGITGIDDPAGLPLLAALLSVAFFLMTPLTNTIIRSNEVEADAFGLNAAQQPDGFAAVALKLGEYRKLAPGPVEELLFFDHPSGKNRILMAMRWKAAHAAGAAVAPQPGSTAPPPGSAP